MPDIYRMYGVDELRFRFYSSVDLYVEIKSGQKALDTVVDVRDLLDLLAQAILEENTIAAPRDLASLLRVAYKLVRQVMRNVDEDTRKVLADAAVKLEEVRRRLELKG